MSGVAARTCLCEALFDDRLVVGDPLGLDLEDARDLPEELHEARPAVSRLLWKIRPAPERLAIGRQEHGERPAALLSEQLQRAHIDMVDIRPLLAIDLDIDEELVHDGRDAGIL